MRSQLELVQKLFWLATSMLLDRGEASDIHGCVKHRCQRVTVIVFSLGFGGVISLGLGRWWLLHCHQVLLRRNGRHVGASVERIRSTVARKQLGLGCGQLRFWQLVVG